MNSQFAMNPGFMQLQTEVIKIPDRMVGLIIGKGGEQISAIQAESECKVQFAPADGSGNPDRECTLMGSAESIMKARELITRIMHKGHDYPPGGGGGMMNMGGGGSMMDGMVGGHMIEMMIPGNKAGIIIGKGGDTIKQLQERTGVRMVIIQETNSPTNYDKPLRITGDRVSCQKAKDIVLELLAEKDMPMQTGSAGGFNDFGQRQTIDMPVPRSMIGIVIGKGGEMIKKLQQDSGARIQFKPDDEMGGPNRMCSIMGNVEQTQAATSMIQDIIENSMQRQGLSAGGDGWGRPRTMDGMGGGGGKMKFGNGIGGDETTYSVPADKCGLVIGKGGETIREICRQSGAHVELNREASANSNERVFRIQGTPDQIRAAIQLVSDKAGCTAPPGGSLGGGGSMGGMDGGSGLMQQQQTLAGLYAQQATSQSQPQLQQQQPQQFALQAQYQYPAAAAYSQAPATDLNKQTVDANTAAWAAYYAQFYNLGAQQPNNVAAASAVASLQQQLQQQQYNALLPRTTVTPQPSLAGLAAAIQQPAAQQNNIATATALAAGGAPDYTAAWADYYRQQGLHQQAQAILMQSAAAGLGLQQPQ